jgi:hypothetical protein
MHWKAGELMSAPPHNTLCSRTLLPHHVFVMNNFGGLTYIINALVERLEEVAAV